MKELTAEQILDQHLEGTGIIMSGGLIKLLTAAMQAYKNQGSGQALKPFRPIKGKLKVDYFGNEKPVDAECVGIVNNVGHFQCYDVHGEKWEHLRTSDISLFTPSSQPEASGKKFTYFPNHGDEDGRNCFTICYAGLDEDGEHDDLNEIIVGTADTEKDAIEMCRRLNDILHSQPEAGDLLNELGEKEVMIKAFADIRKMFEQRSWIMEGRGCYPYNDDRYKEEVRYLYDEFDALANDVFANIKTKTFEYREKIIADYKASQPEAVTSQVGPSQNCPFCHGYGHKRNYGYWTRCICNPQTEAQNPAPVTTQPEAEPLEEEICETCGGDGKETCNNPDHGFIDSIGGETGRLGCPVCGHDPNHKVPNGGKCEDCDGTGYILKPAEPQRVEVRCTQT